MKLNEYQELSKRTMPYNGEPVNQVEFENILGNYALGLVGEAVELLEVAKEYYHDVFNELGDVAHYAVGLATILKVEIGDQYEMDGFDDYFEVIEEILISAKNVSEMAKKFIYHRHDLQDVSSDLRRVINCSYTLSNIFNENYSTVLEKNIDKLKTRYPEQFSVEDSIKRVDTHEH